MPHDPQTTPGLLHDGTPCPHGLWVEFIGNDTCLICGYQTFQNRRLSQKTEDRPDARNSNHAYLGSILLTGNL